MRHQARHAAVAVEKRVNPEQSVMSRRRKNRIRLVQCSVAFGEAREESRYGPGAHRDMRPQMRC